MKAPGTAELMSQLPQFCHRTAPTAASEIVPKSFVFMAEGEGFEPPVPCGTAVFKTAALVEPRVWPGASL